MNSLRCGVILHRVGVSFGISQHFAGGIDDGYARACGLCFLRSDVLHAVRSVGLDPVGEHLRLLNKVAFDLFA